VDGSRPMVTLHSSRRSVLSALDGGRTVGLLVDPVGRLFLLELMRGVLQPS